MSWGRRFGRFGWLLALSGWLGLTGCGESDRVASESQPPQTMSVIAGTGPVVDAADARSRVLQQYLGQTAARQGLPLVIGLAETDPLVSVHQLPNQPTPAGATVGGDLDSPEPYVLPETSWIFWVDPSPAVPLARRCYLLHVRGSDGRILVQAIASDPLVDGQRVFEFQPDLDDSVIYRHGLWEAYRTTAEPSRSPAAGWVSSRSPDGVVKGLVVSGLYDSAAMRELDALHESLTNELGLEPDALRKYYHTFEAPITKDGFFAAIETQCEGLGAGDKFLLVLSTDAGRVVGGFSGTASGVLRIGRNGYVTFSELSRRLAGCKAENINLVLNTNYAGLAIEAFSDWAERSDSRIQILTSTSADQPSLGSWYLHCFRAGLREKLEAAKADGMLTIEEIEVAFAENGVTRDAVRETFLDDMEERVVEKYGPDLSEDHKRGWRQIYQDDLEHDGGETDPYRPNGEPQAGGFDGRPMTGGTEETEQPPPSTGGRT